MDCNLDHRFVALLNKRLESGVALNAIGHMAAGLAAMLARKENIERMRFLDFEDRDGQVHPSISALSLIVLRGTSNDIRTLRQQAREAGLPCVDFTSTMTGGTYLEQLDRTKATSEQEFEYYGTMIFGPIDKVNPITRKYSLWK
jgi:hypothetical protein